MSEDPDTEENKIIDRRKNGYAEVEEKLSESAEIFQRHALEIEARFRRWLVLSLIGFAIIGLSAFVALFGYGLVLKSQSDFTKDIQQQRREATLATCEDTNRRHDHTVEALTAGSDLDQEHAPDEAARVEIRRRRDVTIALIDALAPKQDCAKLTAIRVQGNGE